MWYRFRSSDGLSSESPRPPASANNLWIALKFSDREIDEFKEGTMVAYRVDPQAGTGYHWETDFSCHQINILPFRLPTNSFSIFHSPSPPKVFHGGKTVQNIR